MRRLKQANKPGLFPWVRIVATGCLPFLTRSTVDDLVEPAAAKSRLSQMTQNLPHSLSLVVLIALSGCVDSGRGAVSGKVTLVDQPVDGGTISFIPVAGTEGLPVSGEIIAGQYSLSAGDGAAVGDNRVEIRWARKTGKKFPASAPALPGQMIEQTVEAIPVRYNTQSTLKVTVQQGENTFDFALDSK